MKRLFSITVILALLLSLSVSALADGEAFELELLADDGSTANAAFSDGYTVDAVVNIDGEEREATVVIANSDGGTFTVDKAVSGTGYLAMDVSEDMRLLFETYGDVSCSEGEHSLSTVVDGQFNTDNPFLAYTFYSEDWEQDAAMIYDLIAFTAPDGSPVYVTCWPEVLEVQEAPSFELELLADDGSTASAAFSDGYTVDAVVNIDGEEREATVVIANSDGGTFTVDKAVSGTGYLAMDVSEDMRLLFETYGDVSCSEGEHSLSTVVDEQFNTDNPFLAYTFYSEDWEQDAAMIYDLISFTAPDGSLVYVTCWPEVLEVQEAPSIELELLADDSTTASAVFSDGYTVDAVVNIDGEEREATVVIANSDGGTFSVDKAVSGTGYMAADMSEDLMLLFETSGDISASEGEHSLAITNDEGFNDDSPFFAYTFYSEEWEQDAVMFYDLISFTAPDGSPVYVTCWPEVLEVQPEPEPEPEPEAPVFSDVPETFWGKEYVDFAVSNGIMNGVGEDEFAPNESMTLGMALTVMARLSGVDTSGSSPWYQAGFDWAEDAGIHTGGENLDTVERQELIEMLWKLAGSPAEDPSALDAFPDVSSVSGDCAAAMAWAVKNGITNGTVTDNGSIILDPSASTSRTMYAAFIMRAYDLF